MGHGYRMKLSIIFQLRLKYFVIELILVLNIFGIYSVQLNRQIIEYFRNSALFSK